MEKITKEYVKTLFKKRDIESNKGTFGQSVIIGGSKNFVGAPQFANFSAEKILVSLGEASMRSGCGTSYLAVPDFLAQNIYSTALYSAIFSLSSKDGFIVYKKDEIDTLMKRGTAFAIGMGLGMGDSENIVRHILDEGNQNIVIDADALNGTKNITDFKGKCVLTPHIGEMEKISEIDKHIILKNPEKIALEYAKLTNSVVVLKGSPKSYISDGNVVFENTTGNVRLAKGGSGDILSGIIVGLLAWGMPILDAAKASTYILGRCAELSTINEYSSLPTDIIALIPKVLDEVME